MGKTDLGSPPRNERKLSASSSSMKTKWLKAFRSLKPATAIAGTVKYVFYLFGQFHFLCIRIEKLNKKTKNKIQNQIKYQFQEK